MPPSCGRHASGDAARAAVRSTRAVGAGRGAATAPRSGPRAQPLRGILRGDVALGLGEQLVADHELADVRAQQRREEVGVELPALGRGPAPNGAWCQPIEYGNGRRKRPSYRPAARRRIAARSSRGAVVEIGQSRGRPLGDQQRLERPGGPERHDRQPLVGLGRRPAGRRASWPHVVEQQAAARSSRSAACCAASSRARLAPAARCPAQTWPCGCGLEAPIAAPRFSKTWTQRYVARRARSSGRPRRRSPGGSPSGDIAPSVRSWRGEKQTTRQTPRSPSARRRPSSTAPRTCPAAAPRSRCRRRTSSS